MTFEKMMRTLAWLKDELGYSGQVLATGGGEISLCLNTQVDRLVHRELLRRGFIYWNSDYIYRPYRPIKS